ncbi:MAG: hypothetical protein Q7U38_12010 [Methylobacter sp.]|uniref:hypothetical protein n=1 Tax=Methylicorpusculum sp. TaxID=2713644 RepID=UPI0027253D2C|nr:hypothetical protein [Methylicorpusculum sp.]MDO9141037.1 hypothetical protein [Methylobacter sp.]MDP2178412.1 hypothetical protein [Methylicorpusculum sp.]MDP2429652.1 hypothetical protein [Methylobacter sp.]MDP3053902.1 hypothetical protein [Methylobacter sp.]MDP3360655.1 hypothetical protein [Methylobacter sp.]
MNISPTASAVNLINVTQNKSADAAQVIAKLPMQNNEVGSSEFNSGDIIKPVLSLKEAELETSAAVKLLQADKESIGSLLDIKA